MKYIRNPQGAIYEEDPETLFEINEKGISTRVLFLLPDKRIGSTFPFYDNPYSGMREDIMFDENFDPDALKFSMKLFNESFFWRK